MNSHEKSLEALFYSEASGRVQQLLEQFAAFKANGSERDNIKRILHTLKGSAGLVGFGEEAEMLHQVEEMFGGLDYQNKKAVAETERALKEVVDRLIGGAQGAASREGVEVGTAAPFSLAQRLLASVGRFEALVESWSTLSRGGRVKKDERIRAELSFNTELKELRKHSFRLAFGRPEDLFFGLETLVDMVARAEGKKVRLDCRAEANYLLREYVPELRSALVHLVSNCVVHGLESPDVRLQNGKDETGRVEVTLEQLADSLTVHVCDDGAGVDLKALERRYQEGDFDKEWARLSEQDKLNLLFEAGTSLSKNTTIHAGRGVGLSSVRETAARLGGEVCFEPREVGCCVKLTVPSPFYVAHCLVVEDGGETLSVVSSSMARVVEIEESELPSLVDCLNLSSRQDSNARFALWAQGTSRKTGVTVERCVGLKEIVVYPIPKVDGLPPAIVGLGDFGNHHKHAVDLSRLTSKGTRVRRSMREPVTYEARILVVDDSATTRSILVDVLRRAGFQVVEADDGREALERLGESTFDLVVSDLEMPNLNGLELLEELRAEQSPFSTLPFVLFTSRDDTQSFQKALLLGADRCIGKSAFEEAEFLRLLRELIHED